MANEVPYKFYEGSTNGTPYVDITAGTNTPWGMKEVDYARYKELASRAGYYNGDEFVSLEKPSNFGTWGTRYNYYDPNNTQYKQALNTPVLANVIKAAEAGQQFSSGLSQDENGNWGNWTQINAENAANEAAVAAGTMKKVPIGNGFGYIPTGSAADANMVNIGTNNTANAANVGLPATQGGGGATDGLAYDPDQALSDIYGQRADLQELYGPDGQAINPNDPRVAGIPTILDWAIKYGSNEYPVLKQYTDQYQQGGGSGIDAGGGGSGGGTGAGGGTGGAGGSTGGFSTGVPELDALYQRLEKYITDLQASGQTLNKNIELTPQTIQQFLDQAKNEVEPYYQGQFKTIEEDVKRNIAGLQKQYELQKQGAEAQFKGNLESSREAAAGSGTAFSGARNAGEVAQQASAQRTLEGFDLSTSNAIGNSLRDAESKIGTTRTLGLGVPTLAGSTASTAGSGSFGSGRTLDFYTPQNVTGSLEYQKNDDVRKYTDFLKSQEINKRVLSFGG